MSAFLTNLGIGFMRFIHFWLAIVYWVRDHMLVVGIVALVLSAAATVGMWLIFKKAGKKPWLSVIPAARDFTLTATSWSGLFGLIAYVLLPLLALFNFFRIDHFMKLNNTRFSTSNLDYLLHLKPIIIILVLLGLIFAALAFALHIFCSIKLAKAFNKGTGFTVGLILLAPVFLLLLGLDKSEYVRTDFTAMGLKAGRTVSNTAIYILLVLMTIIWLLPFFAIVFQSFRNETTDAGVMETWRVGRFFPKKWGLQNYKDLFSTSFPRWYLNTFIIALVVCVVQTIMVLCMAYTLSRFRFKMRAKLMRFMMILGMFPGMLTMLILYNVLSDLHLTGAHAVPGLILVYVASSGMGYYVSKGFFDTIPKSLDEAARVDGANRAQVLYKIILPLAKPIVIYTILTAFMAPWGDFVFAAYIAHAKEAGMNVAVGLNSWLDKDHVVKYYTKFCAGGVLVAVPVAILFMCLQKYYVEGVTGGAVKG